ncbi:DinB family protein [Bacillus paralicheniformis]|uniref:DinB family protein n=1 Tax=Bacillus TaxID=1386 RepID=UPI0023514782|nr:DinB family protein [Bacillus paralicheniformis]MDE1383465.1 DinB family protein [Bacillus paralicheniformis]
MTHSALKHLDYHNWANQRVLTHLKSLPEELFTREIKSVFQSVSEVVTHMCVAEDYIRSRLRGSKGNRHAAERRIKGEKDR